MKASIGGQSDIVNLPQGQLTYQDRGEGQPVVFVHGLLVNSGIWDATVDSLAGAGLRCIQPELPMGSHERALHPGADNSPPGVAQLLADFLDALGLDRPLLVGNDSGGAICQLLAAQHPQRISGMVLTNCDIGKTFPPFPYSLLPPLVRMPGGARLLAATLATRSGRRLAYRPLTRRPIADEITRAWVRPCVEDAQIRRDLRKLVGGARRAQTLVAAERLRQLDCPVLFAWGSDDRLFDVSLAKWLAERLPDARIEMIEGGRTFVMMEFPERLAGLITQQMKVVA